MTKQADPAAKLLAEIYRSPDDDAPRIVYADLLLERGDPRGELIQLQLKRAGKPKQKPSARETELIKKHAKEWLGPLGSVLALPRNSQTEFRRGFVAVAELQLTAGKKLAKVLADPAWATIEELEFWDYVAVPQKAALRALRTLEIDASAVPRIAKRREPLAKVHKVSLDAPVAASVLRKAFPGLVTVTGQCEAFSLAAIAEWTACGVDEVELVTYPVDEDDLRAERKAFAALLDALVATQAQVARLALSPPYADEWGKPVVLRRGARGKYERTR